MQLLCVLKITEQPRTWFCKYLAHLCNAIVIQTLIQVKGLLCTRILLKSGRVDFFLDTFTIAVAET